MNVRVESGNDCAVSNKNIEFRLAKTLEDKSAGNVAGNSRNCGLEVSNKFGITFLLQNGNLRIVETNKLLTLESFPPIVKSGIELISLSADEYLVAVAQGSSVHIYDTKLFCQQLGNANPRCSFRVSKSGSGTKQLAWNPGDVRLIAALAQDGTLLNVRILDNWALDAVSVADTAYRCISWSPKGKQIAVGGLNGIIQLKLDLKVAKTTPPPFQDQEPISLHWMSTFQFLIVFQPLGHDDLSLMMLTLSKTADPVYKNFDDAFLSDELADAKVTYKVIPQWKLYLLFSSTSQEVLVANSDPASQNSDFVIQLLEDKYRAALPLDNYIQGAGICLGYNEPVMINGEPTQPWPLLLLLSQSGIVSIFHFINNGAESINTNVAEPITLATAAESIQNVVSPPQRPPPQIQQVAPQPTQQPANLNTMSLFGTPQSTPVVTSSSSSAVGGSNLFGSFNFSLPQQQQPPLLSLSNQPPTTTAFGAPGSLFDNLTFAPQTQQQLQQKVPTTTTSLFGSPSSGLTITPVQQQPSAAETTPKSLPTVDFSPQNLSFSQSAGGGDTLPTSHSISASFKPGQLPTQQEVKDMKDHLKTHEHKILLYQLQKFEQRLANFKRVQAQNIASQSESVKSYFVELDTKIRKDLNSMVDFSHNIVETTNGQREEIDGLCAMLQSQFSKIEYGLIASEKKLDQKYLKLLRAQPIDPTSLAKLQSVEKLFNYVSNQLKESRRHFYIKEQNLRPLGRADTQKIICKTLQNHAVIIQYLNRIILDLRRQIEGKRADQSFNDSDITLDDLASGVSMLKIKNRGDASSNGLMSKFQKTTIISSQKVRTLRNWASQLTVTRVPVSGAIDPFLETKPRRIRLPEEEPEPAAPVTTTASSSSLFSTSSIFPTPITTTATTSPSSSSSLFSLLRAESPQASVAVTSTPSLSSNIATTLSIGGGMSSPSFSFAPKVVSTAPTKSSTTLSAPSSAASIFSANVPSVSSSTSATISSPVISTTSSTPAFSFSGQSFAPATIATTTVTKAQPIPTPPFSFAGQPAVSTSVPATTVQLATTKTPGGGFSFGLPAVTAPATKPSTTTMPPATGLNFGTTTTSSASTGESLLFGSKPFSFTLPSSQESQPVQSSIFGSPTNSKLTSTSTPPQASIFPSPSKPLLPTPTASPSIFGTPSSTSVTASSSIFGTPSSTSVTASSSIFGTPSSAPVTTSIFGTPSASATISSSLFGASFSTPVAATTSSSLFLARAESPIASAAITSTPPSDVATTLSIGGGMSSPSFLFSPKVVSTAPTSTTTPTTATPVSAELSIFSLNALSTTTTPSTAVVTTSSPPPPAFSFAGQPTVFTPATTTTTTTTTTVTQPAATVGGFSFSLPTQTTQANTSLSTTTSSTGLTFGSVATSPTSFGTPTTTTSASSTAGESLLFGSKPFSFALANPQESQPVQSSIFGAATDPRSSSSLVSSAPTASVFSNQSQPPLLAAPTITSSAQQQPVAGLGGFFGGLSFGSDTQTQQQQKPQLSMQASAPVFGGGAIFSGQPFGSTSPQSSFGSSSIFGGAPTFGSLPAPATQTQNVPVFGSGSGIFGGGAAASESPSFGAFASGGGVGSAFGQAPSFGAFNQPLAQQQQQKSSFGSSTGVFGGAPAFGSLSAPATQNASVFGSGSAIFGGGGSPAAQEQPPSFGAFASGGGSAFGQASSFGAFNQQQQPQPQQQQQNSSFGGSSFSSWR